METPCIGHKPFSHTLHTNFPVNVHTIFTNPCTWLRELKTQLSLSVTESNEHKTKGVLSTDCRVGQLNASPGPDHALSLILSV